MARLRRVAVVVLGLPLVLIGAGLLVGHLPAVRARTHAWAESALARYVGREVRAERLDLHLLQARLELRQVRVAHGASLGDGVWLEAEAIRLGWSWSALLRRSLVLHHLRLVRPRLNLRSPESATTAGAGWLPGPADTGPPTPGGWITHLPRVDIEDGAVAWETTGISGRLDGVQGFIERRIRDGTTVLGGDLRAARLVVEHGGSTREATALRVQADMTPTALWITLAEAVIAGGRVAATGRILDPAGAGQLALDLTLSSPLARLLDHPGLLRDVDGHLEVIGHLGGPWNRPKFQGRGDLRLAETRGKVEAVAFALRWADGRLELESRRDSHPDTFQWTLAVEPATGLFRARLKTREVDLDRLTGFPALAARLGGFEMPPGLGGRLTADVDLTGRGADLATLRGRGALRAYDLRVDPGLPPGHVEARIAASASEVTVQTFSLDLAGGTVRAKGKVTFADGRVDFPFDARIRSAATLGRAFGFPLLDGDAALTGRLTGTREAPRLEGHLTWREPRVGMYGVDRIEGEIEWLARTIRSSRLVAHLGQTVATVEGSASAVGSAPLRSLDLRRDVTLDLQARVSSGRTADVAQFFPAGLDVRADFAAHGRFAGTPEVLTGEVSAAVTNVRAWRETWQRGAVVIRFVPDAVEISQLSLRRGTERITGDLRFAKDGRVSGRFATTPLDLGGIGFLAGSQLVGRAALQGEIRGTLQEPQTVGTTATRALSFRGVPLGPGTATFAVGGQTVDVDVTLGNGTQRVQLRFDPPPDRRLRVQVDLSDSDLAPIFDLAGVERFTATSGRGTGRILIHGPANDFANASGDAHLTALHLQWEGEPWANQGPVDLSWKAGMVNLRQVRLASGNRTLDVRGTVAPDGQVDLHVQGRLPLLALAGRIPVAEPMAGTAEADLQFQGTLNAPAVRGTATISEGTFALTGVAAPFEDVHGTVELKSGQVIVRDIRGRFAGGTLRASGAVSHHGDEWSVQGSLQAEGNRVEQVLVGNAGGHEVTGALSAAATLRSQGQDGKDFLRNLSGNLKLAMQDGYLGRQTFAVRVLSLMKLAGVLDPIGTGAFGSRVPYRRLTSDHVIEQGVARTENWLLESPAFNVSAVGQVDLVHESVEAVVAVKPFQTVDKLITAIPLAGWVLGGTEGALIAAFYRVTGPLSDPQVTSLPLKSIRRDVFGTFRRLLELPETVVGP